MKPPDLPDPRLRRLASNIQRSEQVVRELLEAMIDAPLGQRIAMYRSLQAALERIRTYTRSWSQAALPVYFNEAFGGLARSLERAGVSVPSVAVARQASLSGLMLAFSERINLAVQSIGTLAGKLLNATDALDAADSPTRQLYIRKVNAGVPATIARAAALRKFRADVLKHPATIVGASGKSRHYELAYYAAMVASSAYVQAHNLPARVLSQFLDMDLVRVSSNPSVGGDYCDDYAGKVFSLSGEHPRFPALDLTPNGGPPFHTHCYHFLTLVMPGEKLDDEAVVVDSALLKPGETTTKELELRRNQRASVR